jgi:hypothetical protein
MTLSLSDRIFVYNEIASAQQSYTNTRAAAVTTQTVLVGVVPLIPTADGPSELVAVHATDFTEIQAASTTPWTAYIDAAMPLGLAGITGTFTYVLVVQLLHHMSTSHHAYIQLLQDATHRTDSLITFTGVGHDTFTSASSAPFSLAGADEYTLEGHQTDTGTSHVKVYRAELHVYKDISISSS